VDWDLFFEYVTVCVLVLGGGYALTKMDMDDKNDSE